MIPCTVVQTFFMLSVYLKPKVIFFFFFTGFPSIHLLMVLAYNMIPMFYIWKSGTYLSKSNVFTDNLAQSWPVEVQFLKLFKSPSNICLFMWTKWTEIMWDWITTSHLTSSFMACVQMKNYKHYKHYKFYFTNQLFTVYKYRGNTLFTLFT